MSDKRNYGLDLYRILCCVGVLNYHVMDDVLGKGGVAYFLYFAASYCVPGFFLLSGFLLGSRSNVTVDYIENKIIGTMKKLFAWIVLWSILHFIKTGEIYDLWKQLLAGLASDGILPVSWFLFTYSFLLFLGYPLWYLKNKYRKLFGIAATVWIMMLMADVGRGVIGFKTQSLWLHLYIGYFAFGMALTDVFSWADRRLQKRTCIIIASIIVALTSATYIYEFKSQPSYIAPHNYYGKWFYSLWLAGGFWLCTLFDLKNLMLQKKIQQIASDTMVVYLGHLPMLIYITGIHPLQSVWEAIGCVCTLFVLLVICAECMKKLPLLRKIV